MTVTDGICAGARVDTPLGEIAIELLCEGDTILIAGGGIGVIKWIGRIECVTTAGGDGPVEIAPRAVADQAPRRTLLVAPDQAILLDRATSVPARLLVNGITVRRAAPSAAAVYIQIALRDGACFLVDGLGVRSADAPADVVAEPGDRRPALTTSGAGLAAATEQLERRAGPGMAPLLPREIPADPRQRAERLAAVLEAIARLRPD